MKRIDRTRAIVKWPSACLATLAWVVPAHTQALVSENTEEVQIVTMPTTISSVVKAAYSAPSSTLEAKPDILALMEDNNIQAPQVVSRSIDNGTHTQSTPAPVTIATNPVGVVSESVIPKEIPSVPENNTASIPPETIPAPATNTSAGEDTGGAMSTVVTVTADSSTGATPTPLLPAVVPTFASPPIPESSGLPVLLDKATPTSMLAGAPHSVAQPFMVTYDIPKQQADGRSLVRVTVYLYDKEGNQLKEEKNVSLIISGVLGVDAIHVVNNSREIDKAVIGNPPVQPTRGEKTGQLDFVVQSGSFCFDMLAPVAPGEVTLTLQSDHQEKISRYYFDPELRPMFATGLIEGAVFFNRKQDVSITQSHFNDGFDRELMSLSRQFSNGMGAYTGRAAFSLKGTIKGDTLLTATYDSDKVTPARLLANVNPDEFYPVFGDNSVAGSDSRSAQRLYVRLDNGENYALYGDFNTGDEMMKAQSVPLALETRKLGKYNRALTGLRLHAEQEVKDANESGGGQIGYGLTAFASRDSLKQWIEEIRGQGISGPYAVSSTNAMPDTEIVEILIRDRNNVGNILSVTPLQSQLDYSFEPFSGRLLFKSPIPSQDEQGNPESIRITYEVDQGGPQFWLEGIEAQLAINAASALGVSYVHDANPLSPYSLKSIGIAAKLAPKISVSAEVAESNSVSYMSSGVSSTTPQNGQSAADGTNITGRAYRLEGKFATESGFDSTATILRSDADFNNPNAPVQGGRSAAILTASQTLSKDKTWLLVGSAQQNSQRYADNTPASQEDTFSVGLRKLVEKSLTLEAGVRKETESGDTGVVGSLSGYTAPALGPTASTQGNGTGGFFGTGTGVVNPVTGLPSGLGTGLTPSGQSISRTANMAYVNGDYKVSDDTHVRAEVSVGQANDAQTGSETTRSVGVGVDQRIFGDMKAYARAETGAGVNSIYSATSEDRYRALVFGLSKDMGDAAHGSQGTMYSEYRLSNADQTAGALSTTINNQGADSNSVQFANGMRRTIPINANWSAESSAEYIKTLAGTQPSALALTGGLNYRDDTWRTGGQLEYRRATSIPVDNSGINVSDGMQSVLSTLAAARKLDKNWTLLAKNYFLFDLYSDHSGLLHYGNAFQERLQIGAAYRDTEESKMSWLFRYEYKLEEDHSTLLPNDDRSQIASISVEDHPTRPLWINANFAIKWTDEVIDGVRSTYSATLISGRVIYDMTDLFDVGALSSLLWSPQGNSRQYANGLELGWRAKKDLRMTVGYNVRGFYDRDLSDSNYTRPGIFLRMDYKY